MKSAVAKGPAAAPPHSLADTLLTTDRAVVDAVAALDVHMPLFVAEVLSLLANHKLHRLYVVDEAVAPIGLITLTDVLKLLCSEASIASAEDAPDVLWGQQCHATAAGVVTIL
jgi:CBS-domain-containing membrane protein